MTEEELLGPNASDSKDDTSIQILCNTIPALLDALAFEDKRPRSEDLRPGRSLQQVHDSIGQALFA